MIKRTWNLIRGFFGRLLGGIEKRNPEALLEVEKENLRSTISKFNKSLASHAALCERLVTQVRKLEKDEGELRAKAAAYLKAGNRELAGQAALRLQTVRKDLEENTRQAQDAESTYRELTTARDVSIREARTKIEEISRGIDEMKVNKAMAELNEMASGMVNEIGGSGDTLNRLQEMIEEERTKAKGRSRVARDSIDTTDIKQMQAEQIAMEELALADFAAAEGITLDQAAPSSPDLAVTQSEETKSMGLTE